jgi:hypothetical protein
MLLVYLLKWLGIVDEKHTTVRPGVAKFALYSLAALALFTILALSGILDRL